MVLTKQDYENAAKAVECLSGQVEKLNDDAFDNFNGHYTGMILDSTDKVDLYNSFADNTFEGDFDYIRVTVGGEVHVEGVMVDEFADGNGSGESWLGVDKDGRGFTVVLENTDGYGLCYDYFRVITFPGSK